MNFKSIGVGLATAAAVTTGTLMTAAPADALTLAPGTLQFGSSTGTTATQTGSNVTLSFPTLNVQEQGGVFSGKPISSATAVNPLQLNFLNAISSTTLNLYEAVVNDPFLSFTIDGTAAFLKLDSGGKFTGSFTNINNWSFTSAGALSGTLYSSATNQVLARTTIGALRFGGDNPGSAQIQFQTVPTPALLPGLIGMGVAAVRKKRKGEASEATPETVEANA